jgi:metal-sulfur cluster biosynthetic enzyme
MIDREAIIENLKNVYDPEIPSVSLYDLGLIYDIDLDHEKYQVVITHTLTSAFCPFADEIVNNVRQAGYVEGVRGVEVNLTFDPPFSMDLVPEETRLLLGWY